MTSSRTQTRCQSPGWPNDADRCQYIRLWRNAQCIVEGVSLLVCCFHFQCYCFRIIRPDLVSFWLCPAISQRFTAKRHLLMNSLCAATSQYLFTGAFPFVPLATILHQGITVCNVRWEIQWIISTGHYLLNISRVKRFNGFQVKPLKV